MLVVYTVTSLSFIIMVLIYIVFIVKSARPVQPTEEPGLHLQTWGQSCCHWWKQWRPDNAGGDVGWDQLVTGKWKTNSFFSRSSWSKEDTHRKWKGKHHKQIRKNYPEAFVKWIWPTPNRLLLFNKDIPSTPATKRACGHSIFSDVYKYLYIYVCVHIYEYIYIYICLFIIIYTHACILYIIHNICTYVYVYIYIYIQHKHICSNIPDVTHWGHLSISGWWNPRWIELQPQNIFKKIG